jgi:CRISPR-associated protein Cst2
MESRKKGILTLTIITQRATSLNYGENIGNVSILKKLSLGDGSQFTYVSDKALKYEIKRKGKEEKGWKLLDETIKRIIEDCTIEAPIEKTKDKKKNERDKKSLLLEVADTQKDAEKKQSVLDVNKFFRTLIEVYEEFDLFGGMFTKDLFKGLAEKKFDGIKRTSPVKITYAFSISKFQGDMDFMNNIDAFNRYIKHLAGGDDKKQVIAQSEQHTSHYHYTVAIDLDRIGVWESEDGIVDVLPAEEKARRIKEFLDIIMTLSRQIRGRWESLSPIFVIGGIYKVKNPFFMGGVSAKEIEDGKLLLDVNRLLDCMEIIPKEERDNTLCGLFSGFFANEQELREKLNCQSVWEVFEELKKKVEEVYGVS